MTPFVPMRSGQTKTATFGVAVFVCAQIFSAHAQTPAQNTLPNPKPLVFDKVFNTQDEPAQLHFVARYVTASGPHELEVWRDAQKRLRRRTDNNSDAYVQKGKGPEDWSMTLYDHQKKIASQLSREALIKLGQFTDWFDLSHGLTRPFGEYQLSATSKAWIEKNTAKPLSNCQWFDLLQKGQTSHVCWSAKHHLPMLIAGPNDQIIWQVAEVDNKPANLSVWQQPKQGYLHNNASKDILDD